MPRHTFGAFHLLKQAVLQNAYARCNFHYCFRKSLFLLSTDTQTFLKVKVIIMSG